MNSNEFTIEYRKVQDGQLKSESSIRGISISECNRFGYLSSEQTKSLFVLDLKKKEIKGNLIKNRKRSKKFVNFL